MSDKPKLNVRAVTTGVKKPPAPQPTPRDEVERPVRDRQVKRPMKRTCPGCKQALEPVQGFLAQREIDAHGGRTYCEKCSEKRAW